MEKYFLYIILFFSVCFSNESSGQDPIQRPVNLGLSGTLDATPPGTGLFYLNYLHHFKGNSFRDSAGDKIKEVDLDVLIWMHQFVLVSKKKVLGGNLGFAALFPLVHLDVNGEAPGNGNIKLTDSNQPFGDLTLAVSVHWLKRTLFGKPFSHRMELTSTIPVGSYDEDISINPSAPFLSIQPFYSFTYFLSNRFSISQRHHYTFNFNDRYTDQRTGQMYHGIYSFEYRLKGKFWVAIHSYYLHQTTEDKGKDFEFNFETKESVFGIGPAFNWISKSGIMLGAKYLIETQSKKRIKGNRLSFKIIYPLIKTGKI